MSKSKNAKRARAFLPGSFDPFTIGHFEIAKRASAIFDEVLIGIAVSAEKKPLATVSERKFWIEKCVAQFPQISVVSFEGLTVDYMQVHGLETMVRGIRSAIDFEYESQLAAVNSKLDPRLEIVFLLSAPELTHVHSKYVRELIGYKRTLKGFVPDEILLDLERKYEIVQTS